MKRMEIVTVLMLAMGNVFGSSNPNNDSTSQMNAYNQNGGNTTDNSSSLNQIEKMEVDENNKSSISYETQKIPGSDETSNWRCCERCRGHCSRNWVTKSTAV